MARWEWLFAGLIFVMGCWPASARAEPGNAVGEYKLFGVPEAASAISLRPDLILMDMSLPVIDGWEATRQIRANDVTRKIPVIALTAHAMAGDREKAGEAGCDDYDTKPVEISRLLAKITALLATRAA